MAHSDQEGMDRISARPYEQQEAAEPPVEEPEESVPSEATAIPDPYKMSKQEVREWLRTATREEKLAAIAQYAPNPDDIVYLNLDYGDKTARLAEEQRRIQEEREALTRLLQQQTGTSSPTPGSTVTGLPPPAPASTPPVPYEPYGLDTDPVYQRLEQQTRTLAEQLQELKRQLDQRDALEGLKRIKEEMNALSAEYPWFTEADHDLLFAEMQQKGITSARTAFRDKYWDRRPMMTPEETTSAPPQVPKPGAKSPAKIPPMPKNAEEYAEWVAKYHMQEEVG